MSRRAHPVAAVALGGFLWEQATRWYRPPYNGPRRYPLGLGTTVIQPGCTAVISVYPQLAFSVQRLIAVGADCLLIESIRVGDEDSFTAEGAVPVEIFNEHDVTLRPLRAGPNTCVQVTVSNPTNKPRPFSGCLIGIVNPEPKPEPAPEPPSEFDTALAEALALADEELSQ